MKDVFSVIQYLAKSSIQWRMKPKDRVTWQSVYSFRKWTINGQLEDVHDYLVGKVRFKKDTNIASSYSIMDSQSGKTSYVPEGKVGLDGGKRNNGRKRHLVAAPLI